MAKNKGLAATVRYLAGLSTALEGEVLTPKELRAARKMYDGVVKAVKGSKGDGLNKGVQVYALSLVLIQLLAPEAEASLTKSAAAGK